MRVTVVILELYKGIKLQMCILLLSDYVLQLKMLSLVQEEAGSEMVYKAQKKRHPRGVN